MASGSLPEGMQLNNDGTLSGTPLNMSSSGATFSVLAQYLSSSAQQTYTITPAQDPYASNVALYVKGDSDFNDKSSNHFAASAVGTVTLSSSPAVTGSALQFSGGNSYLSYGNNAGLKPGTQDFTVEFWMYSRTGNDGYRRIVTSTLGAFNSGTFVLRHAPGYFEQGRRASSDYSA